VTNDHTSKWFIGIDIGGTFTDVVLAEEGGSALVRKVRTTIDDPVEGVVAGITSALAQAMVSGSRVDRVVHATTLATNLILEGKGARVAFATTKGFGDLIRIPRGGGATIEGAKTLMSYTQPDPFVPSWMTVEVPERIDARGNVVTPLSQDGAQRVAREIASLKPDAIAICFLHSYVNDSHEMLLLEALAARIPHAPTYVSSQISPTLREYGRALVTVISAYVGPAMRSYLERLGDALADLGIGGPIHIMESSGGVMMLDQAVKRAAHTLESGPAAGVVSTQQLSGTTTNLNLLSFDMGGTTAKCGIVLDGVIERKFEFYVGGAASRAGRRSGGFPVRIPVIDLAEVGAGGGSIAWIDEAGSLRVGPQSAGANPGPACYALGGTVPTVTDANLILGYFDPERFAGGTIGLSPELAHEAISKSVAQPLGITALEAASAIFELVTASMAGAIRIMTIERGLDPRDFDLVGFGGSGPVHVMRLAQSFNIARVVVPAHPGVRSAVGLLGADLSVDQVQSCPWTSGQDDVDAIISTFQVLEVRAARALGLPDVPGIAITGASQEGLRCMRMADMRYQGQAHHVTVHVPPGPLDGRIVERLVEAFYEQYKEIYGVGEPGPTEIVNCRLRLEQIVPKWTSTRRPVMRKRSRRATPVGHRLAWFDEAVGQSDVAVYDWAVLEPSDTLLGPALVDGLDSTLVVPSGYEVNMDPFGNLEVSVRN
jgi:N-methylhydantoinase A